MVDVITGGAGFIGSHLCRALVERGRKVRVIDNFSSGKAENLLSLRQERPNECEIFDCDIREAKQLGELFSGVDTVYHLAAITSVQKSVEDPVDCNSVNVEGTLKVLVAARDNGIRKVIFSSSTAVYGDSEELPKQETMKVQPISPYAVSKYVGECYCRVFSETYGLSALALRYFNVFGPGQDSASDYAAVIPRFVASISAGKRPIIFGDGEQSRDFIYVKDVVSANLLAAHSDARYENLNIGSGKSFTLKQLVETLNGVLGEHLKPIYEAARPGEVRHSEADISRAGQSIDFRPEISLQEGLLRTADWFRKMSADSPDFGASV